VFGLSEGGGKKGFLVSSVYRYCVTVVRSNEQKERGDVTTKDIGIAHEVREQTKATLWDVDHGEGVQQFAKENE
jgi:hypothetical protein